MIGLGLTKEQLIERRKGIGGSDALKIIIGGEEWYNLWLDKTGRAEPKKVMGAWDDALRHWTEILNLDWYQHTTGHDISRRGEVVVSSTYGFMRCTLDGYDATDNRVVQAKHVSSFTPDAINWCVEHYSPQLCHEMIASGSPCAAMSIIVGMSEPVVRNITFDPFYAEVYVTRCREFWEYVANDKEPPGGPAPLAPPVAYVDMVEEEIKTNSWANDAGLWLANKQAAKTFTTSAEALKTAVKPNIRRAYGFGVEVTRAKNNSLTVREIKE